MSGRVQVPCNGCRLCCINDAVRLLPEDDAAQYRTEPHPDMRGSLMLAHKPNGECVYLGANGCTIHDRAPTQCRTMDCRNVYAAVPFPVAVSATRNGTLNLEVWRRGRDLAKRARRGKA